MTIAPDHGKLIFRKTERELLRMYSEQSAEAVHGLRTTVRRLEILLEEILPGRDRNQKKLVKMLNQIRKRAGKVRDVDVQLSALRSLKVPQEPRRKTQLMQRLIEVRARHEQKLRKLLTKRELREIRKRLKKAQRTASFEKARDPLVVARQILEAVPLPQGPASEELLHRYRIAVKRARYAAEFAPKSVAATQFIARLKRLQDALGNWHDWLTLTHTAVQQLGEVNESSLVAVLHNVTHGKFRNAVAAVSSSPVVRPARESASPAQGSARKLGARRPASFQSEPAA
jgi:CHAD domain-containing protein